VIASRTTLLTLSDKIVFSKRSLLEFFKYGTSYSSAQMMLIFRSCQITVNTNFTEISKLPSKQSRTSPDLNLTELNTLPSESSPQPQLRPLSPTWLM